MTPTQLEILKDPYRLEIAQAFVSPLRLARVMAQREGRLWPVTPHQRMISDAIVAADLGTGPSQIIISMPPRHGKSESITRRASEWYLGIHPNRKVAIGGYGQNFAEEWGRVIRNDIVQNEDLFGFNLMNDSRAANWWHTDAGGTLWTAGIKSQATGKGAHMLVMDDPIKNAADANSPVWRETVWQEWQKTFYTRLERFNQYYDPIQGCPVIETVRPLVIVVMTRWHLDDLAGRLLGQSLDPEGNLYDDPESWLEIRLPLVWEGDKSVTYTFSNGDTWTREKGDALCPLLMDEKAIETINCDLDTWSCLYQQDPTEASTRVKVYYSYDKDLHEREVMFNPALPLFWALDFNLNPMASVIGQCDETFGVDHLQMASGKRFVEVSIIDEIWQPGHVSDIVKVFAEKYYQFYSGGNRQRELPATTSSKDRMRQLAGMMDDSQQPTLPQPVHLYGDAAGHSEAHAGPDLSAWVTVKRWLKEYKIEYVDHVPSKDPAIKDRVTSVNMALRGIDGSVRLWHDPRCKHLKYDLESVAWQLDGRGISIGKLDPGKGGMLTHISDALGYMIVTKFGVRGPNGDMRGMIAR